MLDAIEPAPLSDKLGSIQARATVGGAELILFGAVGDEITALGVQEALKAITPGATLTVRVNSPGGNLAEGLAIYNALVRRQGTTEMVVEGLAASAASLIVMAGRPITMPGNSFLMLHNPQMVAAGDAEELRKSADILDRLGQSAADIYASRSGQPIAKVAELLAAETWLDAEQAVELGFADRVETPLAAVAHLDLSTFQNVPAALAALARTPSPGGAQQQEPIMSETIVNAPATFAELQLVANRAALGADFIVSQLAVGATMDAARDAALEAVASRSPQRQPVMVGRGNRPKGKLGAMTDALAARMGANSGKPSSEDGRVFMEMPAIEMARELLLDRGHTASRWSRDRVADVVMSAGALTTSDFPILLQSSGNRVLAESYQLAASPLRAALCRERDVPDFRGISVVRAFDMPSLDLVLEHEEVRHGTVGASAEGYKVDTYAKMLSVTRQALVNDDLGVLAVNASAAGVAAATTETQVLVGLLTSNAGNGPAMGDGVSLFSTSHGNVAASGGPINSTTLSAARAALRKLRDTDGVTLVAVTPKYLVVGPDRETEAEQLLVATTVDGGATNPWAGKLTLLVEPRLVGQDWYLFGDPVTGPVLEIAYLLGSGRTPKLDTFEEPDFLGVRFRIVHDFGIGVVGWRGAYRNPGA